MLKVAVSFVRGGRAGEGFLVPACVVLELEKSGCGGFVPAYLILEKVLAVLVGFPVVNPAVPKDRYAFVGVNLCLKTAGANVFYGAGGFLGKWGREREDAGTDGDNWEKCKLNHNGYSIGFTLYVKVYLLFIV